MKTTVKKRDKGLKLPGFLHLVLVTLFFTQVSEAQLTGFGSMGELKLKFTNACVVSQMTPGPYSIRVRAFAGLYDKEKKIYINTQYADIKTTLKESVSGEFAVGVPAKVPFKGSEKEILNPAKLRSLPLMAKPQPFDFENFELSLQMREIELAVSSLPVFSKTTFTETLLNNTDGALSRHQIVGLEISIVGPEQLGSPEVLKSLVAFNSKNPSAGERITEDMRILPGSKFYPYLIDRLWPNTAVLTATSRPFFQRGGEHLSAGEPNDCAKGTSLKYQIDLIENKEGAGATPQLPEAANGGAGRTPKRVSQ